MTRTEGLPRPPSPWDDAVALVQAKMAKSVRDNLEKLFPACKLTDRQKDLIVKVMTTDSIKLPESWLEEDPQPDIVIHRGAPDAG